MLTELARRVRAFLAAPTPVYTAAAIRDVVAQVLVAYDPAADATSGFAVAEDGPAGWFVVHYPFTPADQTWAVPAWLDRARRRLRDAGYVVQRDVRNDRPVLVVQGPVGE